MIKESKHAQKPSVAIIIANWNGEDYLKKCLWSLKDLQYPQNKITTIVVDNGSTDNSTTLVKNKFPHIEIIENNKNLGFAKANNIGIEKVLNKPIFKYIITLNNDTVATPTWLSELVTFMEANKNVGAAVGKVLNYHNRNELDSAGDFFCKQNMRIINRGKYKKDKNQYSEPQEILSASAVAAIFRKTALQEIQTTEGELFDESFISYIEDSDLNLRLRLKGWKCFFVPNAVLYHIGSATSEKISNKYREFYSKRNRILMAMKCLPFFYMIKYIFSNLIPSKKGINFYLQTENKSKTTTGKKVPQLTVPEAVITHIKAFFGAFFLIPRIVGKRRKIQKTKDIQNSEVKRWFEELSISVTD